MTWFKRLFDFCRRRPDITLPYQQELEIVEALKVDVGVLRDVTYVECLCTDIVSFCALLTQANYALHGDILFPLKTFELRLVKRCHFWRDAKGEFIDIAYYLNTYKDLTTRILLRLREIEMEPVSDPKITANIYRLRTVLLNVKGVIPQL